MPFPWKKNRARVTRFSQMVADLHSPKHGASLVVETGFPTSLIDLFVKNRSRFKKSKFKKPVQPEIPDPPPPPPSPATTPPPHRDPPRPISTDAPMANQPVPEDGSLAEVSGRVGEPRSASGSNMVVGVFAKLLVVLVLIASVKSFTVGMTVSAFALVFIEYAGKRVVLHRFAPFSNVNVAMEYLSKKVSSCVWFQKKSDFQVASVQLGSDSVSIDEIEVVEIKSEVGNCCEDSIVVDGHELDWDDSSIGITKPCEISECKIRGSRSGRFKSKMVKKLVPKKFRCSKKEKKEVDAESGSEVSNVVDEDKLLSFEIEEEEENNNRVGEVVVDYGITFSQESLLAKEEVSVTVMSNEKRKIDRVGNSGYMVLLVIVLAGLVVGRFPALMLTVTWCFILKIVKTLWRRSQNQNLPLIECSVPNS